MKIELDDVWKNLLARPESEWRLAEAALCVAAAQSYPNLAIASYLSRLDDCALSIENCMLTHDSDEDKLTALNNFMFVQEGYAGSNDDYFDPKNSFLNDVLDRKVGIPISLSIIYMDIAEHLGLEVAGINFPGHFLTQIKINEERIIVDPYHSGRQLDLVALNDLYRQQTGKSLSIDESSKLLRPAGKRAIIVRLLRNLKRIYIENKEVDMALITIELILSLLPESPDEIRDRGMIYHHIGYISGAKSELQRFLQLVPEAKERSVVKAVIDSLSQQNSQLH